ncbi:hypothetical protein MKX01_035837 [Papaver californicum]|nr:hypothetical protein MKX01_035837 [Papaver californicum]
MKNKMMTQSCIAAPITNIRTSSNTKHHSSNSSNNRGISRDFAVKEESGRTKQRNVVDELLLEKKKKKKKKKGNEKEFVDSNNKIDLRKKAAASSVPVDTTHHRYFHSTSSSSDSSSGGGFSSSETESVYGSRTAKSNTKCSSTSFFMKPIRTRGSSTVHHSEKSDQILRNHQSKSKNDDESRSGGGNGKAKSRAMKIYNDLIKVKQPISPGGKISSFLNSLFTPKRASNLVDNNDFPATTKSTFTRTAPPAAAATTPTCSSASSYSRSCLSNTLSNNGNLKQRSVRFYPVNIILDDHHHHRDSNKPSPREQSHQNHYNQNRSSNRISSEEEFKNKIRTIKKKNNQRFLVEEVIEIDKLLMKNHQRTDEKNLKIEEDDDHEDDYDDDRASYASSDLFELDNLSTIGLEIKAAARFSEELPVYETTHFETNRATANGFRL